MKITANALMSELENLGLEPQAYSGRAMYGKQCVSVTLDRDEGWTVWAIARGMDSELDIPSPNTDQMGLGMVLYWPSLKWPDTPNATK